MKAAFVFDQDRCTGCEACRVACGIENGEGRDLSWRQIVNLNPSHHPALPTRHLSLACNHCDSPACLLGCPAAAYRRDEATGAVLLDGEKCIGCRYCSWVCPYDVPRFDETAGVMSKCTFCSHRLVEGRAPACAQACPTGALSHGPRTEVVGEPVLPGLPSLGLGPALTVKTSFPRIDLPTLPSPTVAYAKLPARKIRLRAEWGLVLFTVAIPALVAWFWAGLLRPESAPAAILVLLAGGLAMGTSTLHLGKPLRAWRAMLNLSSSWLSREILLTPAFLGTAMAARLVSAEGALAAPLSGIALVAGISAVLSIDAVYRRIPRPGTRFHSAETWLTVVFLAGLIGQVLPLWLPAAVLKASFALLSNEGVPAQERSGFPLLVTRLALLLAAAALALLGDSSWSTSASVVAALAGEVLDRCRFYLELEPVSPARLLAMASASVQGTSSATPSFTAFSLNPVTSFAKNESTSAR